MADCAIRGEDGCALPPKARKSWASEGITSCRGSKALDGVVPVEEEEDWEEERKGSSSTFGREAGKTMNCSVKRTAMHTKGTNHHILLPQCLWAWLCKGRMGGGEVRGEEGTAWNDTE